MEFVLGFDGGGTKTEVIAIDLQGNIVMNIEGGASNPKAITFEVSVTNLTSLIKRVFTETELQPQSCLGLCMGLAGVANEQEMQRMADAIEQFLKSMGMEIPVLIRNDAEIALMAGLGQETGIIAIAGTGSISLGLTPDGGRYRAGGWGHILGDKGSGYEIGLQTLQAVMQSYDQVKPPTLLTQKVLEMHHFECPTDLRTYIYQDHIKKQHIAEHARLCIEASTAGDAEACRIITNAAEDMANLTLALGKQHPWLDSAPIAVTGSIFKYSKLFLDTYSNRIASERTTSNIIVSQRKPAHGAAMIISSYIQR